MNYKITLKSTQFQLLTLNKPGTRACFITLHLSMLKMHQLDTHSANREVWMILVSVWDAHNTSTVL
jgi:hypothetical protein